MKLNAYKNFSDFKRKFYEYCVESEIDDLEYPMYGGFVELMKQLSDEESDGARKQSLTAEYIKAARHWPRARWVQAKFFKDYGQLLVGPVDLVLWGCGSGLDLLAFYDQALQCEIPQIWTTVQSVTLLDSNQDRVNRAREIAEVLFPLASGRVVGRVCDFENPMEVSCLADLIVRQSSHGLVPRIHILSESVPTVSNSGDFARQIKSLLSRKTNTGEVYFNDIFCASEPESSRKTLYAKMREFEEVWKGEVGIGSPDEVSQFSVGTYYAFHCITYKNMNLQVALRGDSPVMRELFRIMLVEKKDRSWLQMMYALAKMKIGEQYFAEVYRHVKEIELQTGLKADKKNIVKERCLLFAPDEGVEKKAFLLKLGTCATKEENPFEKMNLAKSWLIRFSKYSASEDVLQLATKLKHVAKGQAVSAEYGKLFGYLRMMAWDSDNCRLQEFPGSFIDSFDTKKPSDILSMFGQTVSASKDEVLPESLNKAQREIVFGRKRQRLVRGGPGTGKTLAMLHHALVAYKRTHLPVLLITKTNSLIGNNFRRLKASYFKKFPQSDFLDGNTFVVANVNELLCQLSKGIHVGSQDIGASCNRELCRFCIGKHMGNDNRAPSEPNDCDSCCNPESARRAVGLEKTDEEGMPVDQRVERMKVLSSACDRCNDEIRAAVSIGDVRIPDHDPFLMRGVYLFRTWGAVLVDEAQLIDPQDMKIIHALTEHFNPFREFYIFADEEQTLHESSLVRGDNGKYSVAVPAKLFGRWRTLKGNHRVKSRNLFKIYRQLQEIMSAKYDLAELQMDEPDGLEEDGLAQTMDKVFRIESAKEMPTAEQLAGLVDWVGAWSNSKTVTIVVDDEQSVREYAEFAREQKWVRTHLSSVCNDDERLLERSMRSDFYEHVNRIHITTIDCAQGQTFENVIFVITRDAIRGNVEEAFTGFTRASRHLYVVDVSNSQWAYAMMSVHGEGTLLSETTAVGYDPID